MCESTLSCKTVISFNHLRPHGGTGRLCPGVFPHIIALKQFRLSLEIIIIITGELFSMYTHFTVGRLHDLFQMIRCKRLFQPIEDRAAVIFGGMFLAVFQQTECDFINRNPVSFIMNEKCKKFFCFPALEGDWGFINSSKSGKQRICGRLLECICVFLFSAVASGGVWP